jgi:hypothetical protein
MTVKNIKNNNSNLIYTIKINEWEREFLKEIGFKNVENSLQVHNKIFSNFTKNFEKILNYNKEEKKPTITIWNIHTDKTTLMRNIMEENLAFAILENMLIRLQRPRTINLGNFTKEVSKRIGKDRIGKAEGWQRYKKIKTKVVKFLKRQKPDFLFVKDYSSYNPCDVVGKLMKVSFIEALMELQQNGTNLFFIVFNKNEIVNNLSEIAFIHKKQIVSFKKC